MGNAGIEKIVIVLPPDGASRWCGMGIVAAFTQRLGQDKVTCFDTKHYHDIYTSLLHKNDPDIIADMIGQSFVVKVFEVCPDAVVVLALSPISACFVNIVRCNRIPILHWFYEDYRVVTYWHKVMPFYSHFAVIQKKDLVSACLAAGVKVLYVPMAAGMAHCTKVEKSTDVSFLGIPTPYRIAALELLAAQGFSLCIGGEGWCQYRGVLEPFIVSRQWTDGAAAWTILHSGRIALNLSSSSVENDRESPQLSPRVFDILAGTTLLLTEKTVLATEALSRYYYKTFGCIQELPGMVSALLHSIDDQLHECCGNRTLVEHNDTYEHRVTTIVEFLVDQIPYGNYTRFSANNYNRDESTHPVPPDERDGKLIAPSAKGDNEVA